jgi:anti-anti-sigma factor
VSDDEVELEVSVDVSGTVVHLTLAGDLDISSAPLVEARISEIRPLRARLVVDVSELLFVDSSGLRALTAARHAAVEDVGLPVTLVGCRDSLRRLLEMTGLIEAFEGLAS